MYVSFIYCFSPVPPPPPFFVVVVLLGIKKTKKEQHDVTCDM